MDRVHEGVHGPGPQWWCMDLESMFCIRPQNALKWKNGSTQFSLSPVSPNRVTYTCNISANASREDQREAFCYRLGTTCSWEAEVFNH